MVHWNREAEEEEEKEEFLPDARQGTPMEATSRGAEISGRGEGRIEMKLLLDLLALRFR